MCQFSPLQIHADSALLAYWALVCGLHVEIVAILVQVMPTWHGHNGGGGSEQVLATDGAIIVHGVWVAFVRGGPGYGNADIAPLRLGQHKVLQAPSFGSLTLQW
jgi:hypothetical protein